MYCPDNGRPSIDPVVLFKMTLIQHIFGIPSLRRTAEEVRANIYYRWFLGYLLNEETPHFSTLSYNFKHRYTNVHDSTAFDGLYDRMTEKRPEIKNVVMDAGYKTPWICKKVFDDDRVPVLPYKRPMGKAGFFRLYEYVFDKFYDCVICPENQILRYATTDREGYKEFKSCGSKCRNCPSIGRCTENSKYEKTVTKHIWNDYLDRAEDVRHTPEYKVLYDRRKETVERVFADAKEKHAMRYTYLRGLTQVTNWVRLKFAAMNLKKFAINRWRDSFFSILFEFFNVVFV